jgi:hypothetical protein
LSDAVDLEKISRWFAGGDEQLETGFDGRYVDLALTQPIQLDPELAPPEFVGVAQREGLRENGDARQTGGIPQSAGGKTMIHQHRLDPVLDARSRSDQAVAVVDQIAPFADARLGNMHGSQLTGCR